MRYIIIKKKKRYLINKLGSTNIGNLDGKSKFNRSQSNVLIFLTIPIKFISIINNVFLEIKKKIKKKIFKNVANDENIKNIYFKK